MTLGQSSYYEIAAEKFRGQNLFLLSRFIDLSSMLRVLYHAKLQEKE